MVESIQLKKKHPMTQDSGRKCWSFLIKESTMMSWLWNSKSIYQGSEIHFLNWATVHMLRVRVGRQLTKSQCLQMTLLCIASHRLDEARIDLGVIWLSDDLGSLVRSLSSSPCVFSHLGIRPCLLLAGKHTFQSHLSIFIAWWLTYSRVSLNLQCLL